MRAAWIAIFFLCACSASEDGASKRTTCGGDTPLVAPKATGDTPDLSCRGKPEQPLGCDEIAISGRIVDLLFGEVGLEGGAIEMFDENDQSIAKIAAADDGNYSVRFPVSKTFRGRILATVPERWNHDAYFSTRGLRTSVAHGNAGLATTKAITAAAEMLGLPPPNTAKAILDPWAIDCAGKAMHDVTIDIDRPYEKRLYGFEKATLDRATTDGYGTQPGAALFLNVDPGPVTVTVKSKSGETLATAKAVARASHWTAIFASPQ